MQHMQHKQRTLALRAAGVAAGAADVGAVDAEAHAAGGVVADAVVARHLACATAVCTRFSMSQRGAT